MASGQQFAPSGSLEIPYFEPLLTSREAAPYMRMHFKTLEQKARLGLVPAMKDGKSWLFRLSHLSAYVDHELKSNLTNHTAPTQEERSE